MFDKCANCGNRMLFGKTKSGNQSNNEKKFCSKECMMYFNHPEFCDECLSETTDESAKYLLLHWYFIGIGFPSHIYNKHLGKSHECQTCHSVIQRLWFILLLIPLIPLSKYRVKYRSKNQNDVLIRKTKTQRTKIFDFIPSFLFFSFIILIIFLSINNNVIHMVKNQKLELCPNITVGQMVDGFIDSPSWESYTTKEEKTVVNISGAILVNKQPVKIIIQFKRVDKNAAFEVNALEFNKSPQTSDMIVNLMRKICKSVSN
jgi:hypothetical protein